MTITAATPDRAGNTSISKYEDVEVGQWFRAHIGSALILKVEPVEVVDLEWDQGAQGAIVYTRMQGGPVTCQPFATWRRCMRPTLPPWAE